jgi:hypothetical protein
MEDAEQRKHEAVVIEEAAGRTVKDNEMCERQQWSHCNMPRAVIWLHWNSTSTKTIMQNRSKTHKHASVATCKQLWLEDTLQRVGFLGREHTKRTATKSGRLRRNSARGVLRPTRCVFEENGGQRSLVQSCDSSKRRQISDN